MRHRKIEIVSTRRDFLRRGSALLGAGCLLGTAGHTDLFGSETTGSGARPYSEKLGDRLWAWCHYKEAYYKKYGLPGNCPLEPAQGAQSLGISNAIVVRYDGKPEPPYEKYWQQFQEMKRVYWSFVGASGRTSPEERAEVLQLATRHANIKGIFMDDFFHGNALPPKEKANIPNAEPSASCSIEQLRNIRPKLQLANRQLDLGVTLYTHQLNPHIKRHLSQIDVVSFWTWKAADLVHLEENFKLYESLVPGKRTLLGIYMWNFGLSQPMPMDLMKHQLNIGYKLLHEKRIEGLIFLATNICELGLEPVEWSKKWIAEHADENV